MKKSVYFSNFGFWCQCGVNTAGTIPRTYQRKEFLLNEVRIYSKRRLLHEDFA